LVSLFPLSEVLVWALFPPVAPASNHDTSRTRFLHSQKFCQASFLTRLRTLVPHEPVLFRAPPDFFSVFFLAVFFLLCYARLSEGFLRAASPLVPLCAGVKFFPLGVSFWPPSLVLFYFLSPFSPHPPFFPLLSGCAAPIRIRATRAFPPSRQLRTSGEMASFSRNRRPFLGTAGQRSGYSFPQSDPTPFPRRVPSPFFSL